MGTRKHRRDARKLERLRLQIKAGAEAIARGEYVDVDDAELEGFLDR